MSTAANIAIHADDAILAARGIAATALAAAWIDPHVSAPGSEPPEPAHIREAWGILSESAPGVSRRELGLNELPADQVDIADLCAWLAAPAPIRADALQAVFGLVVSKDCPLYECEYIPSRDASTRTQHLADLAGFFAAFGLRPWPHHPARQDHVAMILSFAALLSEKQLAARAEQDRAQAEEHELICRDAATSFMRDHVAWWMPTFGRLCEEQAVALARDASSELAVAVRHFSGAARVLRAWVGIERMHCAVEPVRRIVQPDIAAPDAQEQESCGECDFSAGSSPGSCRAAD